MVDFEKVVLEAYESVVKSRGLKVEVNLASMVDREHGFDSLGFVEFVVELEERLGMTMEQQLKAIRSSKSLAEIAKVLSTDLGNSSSVQSIAVEKRPAEK